MRTKKLLSSFGIAKVLRLMQLCINANAVKSIFARLKNSIVQWASYCVEYHGVDTLTWVDFKRAYIRSDYGGLCRKNRLFSSNYSDQVAWRKIIEEYSILTGAEKSNLVDLFDKVQRWQAMQVRIESILVLIKYDEKYINDLLKLTCQPTYKLAVGFAKRNRSELNDFLLAYEKELKSNSENKSDPAEYFVQYEYAISKHCGYRVVDDKLTVKEMAIMMEIFKSEIKAAKNGGQ